MKAVIIAAGPGKRLRPFTNHTHKCLLEVGGKPIIEYITDALLENRIDDIVVVVGHFHEKVKERLGNSIRFYYNHDYKKNNILVSLFFAEEELKGDVIVIYSDIIIDRSIIKRLMDTEGDICVVADEDWQRHYENRKDHSLNEAEKVVLNGETVKKIGKHLKAEESQAEFIGIVKFTKSGTDVLKETYHDTLNAGLDKPFEHASSIDTAYLTDMLQTLIDRGHRVTATLIKSGWEEIDTLADLKKSRESKIEQLGG